VEEPACLWLFSPAVLHNVVEQLTARSVLHDQVQLSGSLDDFVELYYVCMSDQLQDVNLACHPLNISDLDNAFLF
jgi:hypothetical protein